MILLAAFALTIMLGYVAWSTWQQRRPPAELRGDWWTQFELEFRAYADRAARRADNLRRASGDVRREPR